MNSELHNNKKLFVVAVAGAIGAFTMPRVGDFAPIYFVFAFPSFISGAAFGIAVYCLVEIMMENKPKSKSDCDD